MFSSMWDFRKFYSSTGWKKFFRANQPKQRINFANVNDELMSAAIFYATNYYRIKYGLKPFKYSRYLQASSIALSKDLVMYKIKKTYRVRSIAELVRKFTKTGYRYLMYNGYSFCALNTPPGTLIKPPNNFHGSYYDYRGRKVLPKSYLNYAFHVVGQMLNNRITRYKILSRNLTVMGTGSTLYYFNKLPIFLVVQIFADNMLDEVPTSDSK